MFNPGPMSQVGIGKDTRNRHLDRAHDPKKRENFQEEMERNEKKAEKYEQKRETLEEKLKDLPSDEEDLNIDQMRQKIELQKKIDQATLHENRNKMSLQNFEGRIAKTNVKETQIQIKQGKHKHMNAFGSKYDDPLA